MPAELSLYTDHKISYNTLTNYFHINTGLGRDDPTGNILFYNLLFIDPNTVNIFLLVKMPITRCLWQPHA